MFTPSLTLVLLTSVLLAGGALTPGAAAVSASAVATAQAPETAQPPGPRSGTARAPLTLRFKDRSSVQRNCELYMFWGLSGISYDDYLEEKVGISFTGGVDCDFPLNLISGDVGMIDRSPSYEGEVFDGRVLGSRGIGGSGEDASASGAAAVMARTNNGGRSAEPWLELHLVAPAGTAWEGCYPVSGLRYLVCEGQGSSELHVALVAPIMPTGLTQACRVQSAQLLDVEQRRLTAGGLTPASTQILRRVSSIESKVTDFKRELCGLTTEAAAGPMADLRGVQLWTEAVRLAKLPASDPDNTSADDRPLYWARLSMTAALKQWRPRSFPVSGSGRADFVRRLDRASRGMTSHDFSPNVTRKAFVSGFDPFGLNSQILTTNPSGAAALRLDGEIVGGAEVQTVIFPVRYLDFDHGLVESVFTPHLAAGQQRADIITTVSQGGHTANFELEFYNGRKRWLELEFRDNLDVLGAGTGNFPLEPVPLAPGPEFVQTTLPVDPMKAADPATTVDTSLIEQFVVGGPRFPRTDGPSVPASLAVEGSGAGFLSNEIAYRVTLLRDRLGSPVPSGHVHTPVMREPLPDSQRTAIADRFRTLLNAGIAATAAPQPPVRLTASSSLYVVWQVPIYSVTGPPNTQIIWYATHNGALVEAGLPLGTTDANGNWTGAYHAWAPGQSGQWVKYVRVGGRLAQVTMTVL